MDDRYQEVEVTSWGQRVINSCLGVLVGIVLFFAAFYLLFWNETRINLAHLAEKSVEIAATSQPQAARGQLVSLSGEISSQQLLGDNLFLQPGRYIFSERTVEMFAWDEDKDTETRKNWDGSETKVKTYTYSKEWTNTPENSREFKRSKEHQNPAKSIPDRLDKVSNAQIGRYHLDMGNFTAIVNHKSSCTRNAITYNVRNNGGVSLPANTQLQLSSANIKLTDGTLLVKNYIFKGSGTPQNPQIGDLRICYRVLPAEATVTIFGQLENSGRIIPYTDQKTSFYRLIPQPRREAILWLANEHRVTTWILRGVGFLMMWFGLVLAGSPISVLLDRIPFLGDIVAGINAAVSFMVALSLSFLTILVARLTSDPIVLLVVVWLTIGLTVFLRYKQRQWQYQE